MSYDEDSKYPDPAEEQAAAAQDAEADRHRPPEDPGAEPGPDPWGVPQPDTPARHLLPVPWTDAVGQLNVDQLRTLSPIVQAGLIDALRSAATAVRAARGTVVVPEDTYDLTRRVVAAGEVLRQMRDAFEAAAKEADAIAEEEALTAVGGLPGYEEAPSGSHFVPDGAGQRIAVTPQWKAGQSTWDVDTLSAWVAEQTVADEGRHQPEELAGPGDDPAEAPVWTNDEAVSLVRDGMDRLLRLGSYTPAVAKIEAERRRLAGLQRDSDAAVLRQVRSVGLRAYQGVKITREPLK